MKRVNLFPLKKIDNHLSIPVIDKHLMCIQNSFEKD